MSQERNNLLAFPGSEQRMPALATSHSLPHSDTLRLATSLQRTLDIHRLLPLFHEWLLPYLAVDGFEYQYSPLELRICHGIRRGERVAFQLKLEQEPLGEIIFFRRRPYGSEELRALDEFLSSLLYPLRNNLLYHRALQAAHSDALTGVSNRNAFQGSIVREVMAARRMFAPLSLVIVDVDHFKHVNDNYGHPIGDEVLKVVASRVKDSTRGSDLVFRYGGEEFIVLLANADQEGAAQVAERIRSNMELRFCTTSRGSLPITVSVGVATLVPGEAEDGLLGRADQALYQAKQEGRNRVVIAR